jgi:serine/threonine protein kinase
MGSKTFISDVTEVLARVCEALHRAHQKSIYHLCVLPSDILIDDNDHSKVKLVGFGAQILFKTGHLNAISASLQKFLPPEFASGAEINPSCDIYSFAITLSDACPEISFWNDLLVKSKSKNPSLRPPNAREFRRELRKLADGSKERGKGNKTGSSITGGLNPVLTIKTDPEGAEIWSNDNRLGITPSSGLMVAWKPGTVLKIRKTGYSTETLDLKAPPENTEINVKLQSFLMLYTNPWGASVRVNGKLLGSTTYKGLSVPWDQGEIVVEKEGYNSERLMFVWPPSDNETSLELKRSTSITSFLHNRRFRMLAYGLFVLVLFFHFGLIGSGPVKKDSDFSSRQVRLVEPQETWKIDSDEQLNKLRQELQRKNAEIAKLTQSDQEKSRLQAELQRLKQTQAKSHPVPSTKPSNKELDDELSRACYYRGNIQEIRDLIAKGANPDTMNITGMTPLMVAAIQNNSDLAQTLLDHGANVSMKDNAGWTAGQYAEKKSSHKVLDLLRKHK